MLRFCNAVQVQRGWLSLQRVWSACSPGATAAAATLCGAQQLAVQSMLWTMAVPEGLGVLLGIL
jgi:hypothetical protein